MFTIIRRAMSPLCALALLAACATDPAVTRARLSAEYPLPRATTELGREFLRQTPWFVNFAFDSAALDPGARARLDEQAAWIIAHPAARFLVIGHTDLMGSETYNQRLGTDRAEAVVAYLVARGVPRERLKALTSLGETNPIMAVAAPLLENRRAITLVEGTLPEDTRHAHDRRPTPLISPVQATAPAPATPPQPTPATGGEHGGGGGSGGGEGEADPDTGGREKDKDKSRDKSRSRTDAGRGNGDEDGDPGKSEGRNNGGDE